LASKMATVIRRAANSNSNLLIHRIIHEISTCYALYRHR
jgi:hypothetical protein